MCFLCTRELLMSNWQRYGDLKAERPFGVEVSFPLK